MAAQQAQAIHVQGLEESSKTPNATRWNTACQGGGRPDAESGCMTKNRTSSTNSKWTGMVPVDDTALAVTDTGGSWHPCGLPQWPVRHTGVLAAGHR
jgi:hypothetical protein